MRYWAPLMLLLVLIAAAPDASAQPKKSLKTIKDEASKAFDQKKYREAADKYGEVVAQEPNNAIAHFRKGFAHYSLNEYDKAVAELGTALSQGFQPPLEIYKVRSYIYAQQKNYDAALDDAQKGLALAPADKSLLNRALEVNVEKKAYSQAIEAGDRILKTDPNNADVHYRLAQSYSGMGNTKGQKEAAEKALNYGTTFPTETYFLLADACERLRDVPCAITAYQKAINVKPDRLDLYRKLAQLYKDDNRVVDAMNLLKQAQQRFPSDAFLFVDLSRLYSLADRPDDAAEAGRAALRLLPENPAVYTNMCRAYNDAKSYDLAISSCNSALRMVPGDGETYFYLGRAYDLSRRTAEATKAYSQAVKGLLETTQREPSSPDAWYLLGNAYFSDGQREKAAEAYLKTLTLAPRFARARYNLGIIYTRLKNKAGATEQYTALQPLDPKLAISLKSEIDRM